MTEDRLVSDVGEWGLLDALRRNLPTPPEGELWLGDDAAVLSASPEKLVFTTDVMVEGFDFDLAYCPAQSIGGKAVAVNASDVAAMGARPHWAVATLTLPPETPVDVVDDLARGMADEARRSGLGLVGGDISQGRELSISLAMIGTLPGAAVTRSGADVGDLICVTGSLGGAAAGLMLLRAGPVEAGPARRLAARQLAPHARTEEGPLLADNGATSMIDVSDGLLSDLTHVLDASGVGCKLEPAGIPVDPDLSAVALPQGIDPLDLALTGGEDFELLFTIAPSSKQQVQEALAGKTTWSVIGEIVETGRSLGDRSLDEWEDKGWEHLQHR